MLPRALLDTKKSPKMGQNSIISSFFARRAKKNIGRRPKPSAGARSSIFQFFLKVIIFLINVIRLNLKIQLNLVYYYIFLYVHKITFLSLILYNFFQVTIYSFKIKLLIFVCHCGLYSSFQDQNHGLFDKVLHEKITDKTKIKKI